MRRGFLILAGSLALLAAVSAQGAGTAPRAEILVLGTYHMDNPGLDVFNVEADDVLSAKRQAEIEALVEALARFEPTAIAVEAPIGSERVAREYADHRAGKYALSRNEIDQIGYRLAARLGHAVVHPVDVAGDFPFEGVQRFARANGREAELESLMADTGRRVKAQGEYLATHSVLDTLRRINDDAQVREDQSFYARLMYFGAPGDWAGAEVNAAWYRRNAQIFGQILKLTAKPGARVLVVYGAGHLALLRQFVAADPTLVLRSLEDVAGP